VCSIYLRRASRAPLNLDWVLGSRSHVDWWNSTVDMLGEYQPELILLDIGMRGLDGYETCQRIRHVLGNRVVVVALSGFSQDKERATRAGFDAHLTKPADGAALAGILADNVSSGSWRLPA
jgi:CheY-like chemotaxis protein